MISHHNPQRHPKNVSEALDLTEAQETTSTTNKAADLPEYWREHYEERAAIREHEGGQPRD